MELHILVVDDEVEITDLIELYLTSAGFIVHKFYQGEKVLEFVENHKIDLAILDIMLPDTDGYTLCEIIRKNYTFPIIMLTAKGEEIDKIRGLTIGADAYLTKPFKPLELVANVKAQLRRFTQYNRKESDENMELVLGGLVLNKSNHQCFLNEKELSLTPTEFSLLWLLCEKKGQAVAADELFQKVWKEKYYTNASNTIMVHIRHLREKMGDTKASPKYIKTVWGVGYKIEE